MAMKPKDMIDFEKDQPQNTTECSKFLFAGFSSDVSILYLNNFSIAWFGHFFLE